MIELTTYADKIYDEERALYGIKDALVEHCRFEGPADGESALKETENVTVNHCAFLLRYPFWHTTNGSIYDCKMTETCRAALWYDKHISIEKSVLGGIKAVRECEDTEILDSEIHSVEFGWFCKNLSMKNCKMTSEYPFLKTSNLVLHNCEMQGKYSFQYVENAEIRDCILDTKDAFWHSKNVTVTDCVVKGEYLGWYSENLKLVRCKIIGTQPLCYAKNLVLEDCEMVDCDLAFEKSDVRADVRGSITSVKNPKSGRIAADSFGDLIYTEGNCEIISKKDFLPEYRK